MLTYNNHMCIISACSSTLHVIGFISTSLMTYYTMQDDLTKQSSQGAFTQSGRMDILATAIGRRDYAGQVRGESRGTGIGKYFGRTSQQFTEAQFQAKVAEMQQSLLAKIEAHQQHMQNQMMKNMREEIRVEVRTEMRAEFAALLKSGKLIDELKNIDSPVFRSSRDSNHPHDTEPLGDPSPDSPAEDCTLYLDGPYVPLPMLISLGKLLRTILCQF